MRLIITLIFTLFILNIQAQNFTINGYVKDKTTGEDIIGATIKVVGTNKGITTNTYGFYSITLPKGNYSITVINVGYLNYNFDIDLSNGNIKKNIDLDPEVENLYEVELVGKKSELDVRSTQMGVNKISGDRAKEVPLLFGESDIIKVAQFMPGVSSMGEGTSGFIVRGGGPDQNLILLDEATVYNASHLAGFFSVFNSDAIKNMELYKGTAPAKYGGRASSVMDITLKEGNMKDYKFTGGIGLISSRLTVEGPIQKDKSSFIISGRRTYFDLFLKLTDNYKDVVFYFYDLNAKLNFKLGKKDKIFISSYFGRDAFGMGNGINFNWGNIISTFRWNHIFTDKLFLNTTFVYSKYDYSIGIGSSNDFKLTISSFLENFTLKQDYTYYTSNMGEIHFGLGSTFNTFTPGGNIKIESNFPLERKVDMRYGFENFAYISNEQKFLEGNLSINYGLRFSLFNLVGPGKYYTFEQGEKKDSTEYNSLDNVKNYVGIEPRISTSYAFNDNNSIKTSYNRNFQYIHLLSNNNLGAPTDIWIPSSNIIKPQISDQISLGYFFNFANKKFEASIEGYYKWLQNQIEYKPGTDLNKAGNQVEGSLLFGEGRSYGLEFFLKKTEGKLTGWISYTLSRSLRQFDQLNDGIEFPYRFDRVHDVSIVATYKINKKVTLSSNWVFNTGNAVSFPSGRYKIGNSYIPYYGARNGQRMPNYHRLDFGLNYYILRTKDKEMYWSFSIYNAYLRENAWSIDFREEEVGNEGVKTGNVQAVQTSLFSIIPSVSWNFKF